MKRKYAGSYLNTSVLLCAGKKKPLVKSRAIFPLITAHVTSEEALP